MTKQDALRAGLSVAGALFPQIGRVEALAKALPDLKGAGKENAAIALLLEAVSMGESLLSRDVVNDQEVERAIRGVIQAVVALQHVLVKHAQPLRD